jgi:hypothetical protein
MRRTFFVIGLALVVLVALAACVVSALPAAAPVPTKRSLAPTLTLAPPCEACAQATLDAALTQAEINLSALQAQATATADILRVHALATANAVAATQSAAQAQEQRNADALEAQVAATAEILQAHTLATALAAAATQSSVETQAQHNAESLQTRVAATAERGQAYTLATAAAATTTQQAIETEAILRQARRLQLTSGAATENAAATATQEAVAQAVSRTATAIAAAAFHAQSDIAQRPAPSALLWMWLTPLLTIAIVVVSLWGGSRWLTQRRNGARAKTLVSQAPPLPALLNPPPPLTISMPLSTASQPRPGDEPNHSADQSTALEASQQVRGWLEEVKYKLSQPKG